MADQEEPPELGRLTDSSFLWRASLWGGAAIVALASAILITQTDIGSQRLQLVFGSEPSPSRVVTQADFVAQPDPDMQRRETARLEAQVRELAADRERLAQTRTGGRRRSPCSARADRRRADDGAAGPPRTDRQGRRQECQ